MPRSLDLSPRLARWLPWYYGWVVVAVAFVTMGVAVSARTAFSLFFPPILEEFGWGRSATAAAFSIGFAVSLFLMPVIGILLDRIGPRWVISIAAFSVSSGLLLATVAEALWQIYLTLGVLVVGGSIGMSYITHGAFVPNWFARRRGFAIGVAYSGVGVGAIVIFPWLQHLIDVADWRAACRAMAWLVLAAVVPLNLLLQRRSPDEMGLAVDGGDGSAGAASGTDVDDRVVDRAWAATDWTTRRAVRTARFQWLFAGFFCALFVWYAVQVHQTRYLIDIGFASGQAALALGLVPLLGIGGQIGVGYLSDRIGREWGWTIGCLGFTLSFSLLLVLEQRPEPVLMYAMVTAQGLIGYGLSVGTSAIAADLFQGRHFGRIFGVLNIAVVLGGAAGAWVPGLIHDRQGDYVAAFALALGLCLISIACIWRAAPRHVRRVAGRAAPAPR